MVNLLSYLILTNFIITFYSVLLLYLLGFIIANIYESNRLNTFFCKINRYFLLLCAYLIIINVIIFSTYLLLDIVYDLCKSVMFRFTHIFNDNEHFVKGDGFLQENKNLAFNTFNSPVDNIPVTGDYSVEHNVSTSSPITEHDISTSIKIAQYMGLDEGNKEIIDNRESYGICTNTEYHYWWLDTLSGKKWLMYDEAANEWLNTIQGQTWLQTNSGKHWLSTNFGSNWLSGTVYGIDWLLSEAGTDWMANDESGRKFLSSTWWKETFQATIRLKESGNYRNDANFSTKSEILNLISESMNSNKNLAEKGFKPENAEYIEQELSNNSNNLIRLRNQYSESVYPHDSKILKMVYDQIQNNDFSKSNIKK